MPNNVVKRRIIILSDGTGETAAQMIQAAMVQFSHQKVSFTRYKSVRNESQIQAICEDASINQCLLVYTIASTPLRTFLVNEARSRSIPYIDLLGPLLVGLGNYFGYQPSFIAGLLHDVNERYFDRIDAMEYTIAHDDGRELSFLNQAHLVLLGISRTSKTPLSMYLSHQGWRVANIPLIAGFQVPQEVYQVDPRRVIGLTIDAQELSMIRRARLERLGQSQGSEYADLQKVNQEIEYANEIFKKNRKWFVFNVTGKALEETASEIIKLITSRQLNPPHTLESHAFDYK
jgi:hypothetical protein